MKLSHNGMFRDYMSIIKTGPLLINNVNFHLKFSTIINGTLVATGAIIIIICEGLLLGNDPITRTSGYCPQEAGWKGTAWESRTIPWAQIQQTWCSLESVLFQSLLSWPGVPPCPLRYGPKARYLFCGAHAPLQPGHVVLWRSSMYPPGVKVGWILVFQWGREGILDTWALWSHALGGEENCCPSLCLSDLDNIL